ncbi:Rhotekin, partial [Daphnia magna]
EYDLEQKIDVEIRIREGTTKLLAACQHPSQALEAAKTLHTSNERMNVYMTELQSRKRELSRPAAAVTTSTSS